MDLLQFLKESPTAFHAAANLSCMLEEAGYARLREQDSWQLQTGGKYFVTRNDSAVIAFSIPSSPNCFSMTASHSDSPCFKLKEHFYQDKGNYAALAVESYGGGIYSTWFDRPLSIAGRVLVQGEKGIETKLVNLDEDLLVIPNLPIHFNREVNNGVKLLASVDMCPVTAPGVDLMKKLNEAAGGEILSADLFVYCRETPKKVGEYLMSPRIDDLQCAYATLQGFLEAEPCAEAIPVYACFDNEEVGSGTRQGAASRFCADTLRKITHCLGYDEVSHLQFLADSFLLSADNAHALHPNHPEIYDANNRVYPNAGVVIKHAASQSYTTDGYSSAVAALCCKKAGVPCQHFANHSDKRGGGTLGAILSASVSVPMADIGLAQLAMHSAVETGGLEDCAYLEKMAQVFYREKIR